MGLAITRKNVELMGGADQRGERARQGAAVPGATGRQALEEFSSGKYDVAILDLGMPGLPGDQVARRLQQVDPVLARVLFSGWELEMEDPRRPLFDFALRKPLRDFRAVEEMVAQAIVLHDQRQQV